MECKIDTGLKVQYLRTNIENKQTYFVYEHELHNLSTVRSPKSSQNLHKMSKYWYIFALIENKPVFTINHPVTTEQATPQSTVQ